MNVRIPFPSRHFHGAFALVLFMLVCCSPAFTQKKKTPKEIMGYGPASYSPEQAGSFMKSWIVSGPISIGSSGRNPDAAQQELSFKADAAPIPVAPDKPVAPLSFQGKTFAWQHVTSPGFIVNLDSIYKQADFSSAYALAEIKSGEKKSMILALGSDDGVRVWLNGKLIHDNWIPRGVTADADVVPLDLIKGSNQILIKVQDMQQGWGFCARLLDERAISEQLVSASGRGLLDQMEVLLNAGANINFVSETGMSAIANARIQGRDEAVRMLTKRGSVQHQAPPGEILTYGLFKFLNGKESSGVAVLVAKNGKVLYKNGFGYANIESHEKIGPSTKFRIGSITKQFTASAILKLEEEGKLKLTDKLSQYFPDFPRGNEVTINHLLTHTSGIHSYTGKEDFIRRVETPITSEELVNYFKNDPYDFNPGERYQYNNSGFFLAGLIVEKVSGKTLGDFFKERFFDPLKMTNTGMHASTLKLTNEARGYTKENGVYKPAVNWDMSWAGGAGALYSTVEDLFLWNEAVFNGKVLSEKSLKAATTAGVLNNGKAVADGGYGYGWALGKFRGEDVVDHGGGLHGFISQLSRYRKNNLTVVILTNLSPSEVSMNMGTIAEYFLWDVLEKQKSYSVKDEMVVDGSAYVGRYDFTNGMVMTVTNENKNLYAQLSGQAKFQIFPAGNEEFFWKVVEARIKFVRDSTGAVSHGDFTQNGHNLKVMKLKDPVIIAVNPATYSQLVGKYDYGSGMVITVTTENQKLFAQATNQPRFELFPTAEMEYMLKDINASVTFRKADDGTIKGMQVNMAGQKKDAPRLE
jgi:CubicO group peptidase (beta-lactamase class C family)